MINTLVEYLKENKELAGCAEVAPKMGTFSRRLEDLWVDMSSRVRTVVRRSWPVFREFSKRMEITITR